MKTKLALTVLLSIIGVTTQAQAPAPKVLSGSCRVESTKEEIEIKNLDPVQFGMFAKGVSKDGYVVYLTDNFQNAVSVELSAEGNNGYSIAELKPNRVTKVRTGITFRTANNPIGRWLSCDLEVGS